MKRLFVSVAVVIAVLLVSEIVWASEAAPVSLTPTKTLPASPELLALGREVYQKQCAACHGLDGRGNGEAAYLLYPKPRDFVAARYRSHRSHPTLPRRGHVP